MSLLKLALGALLVLLVVVIGAGWWFMHRPAFGQAPQGATERAIRASAHQVDGEFRNELPTPLFAPGQSMGSVLLGNLKQRPQRLQPAQPLPSVKLDLRALPRQQDLVVWLGHSSFFIQLAGQRIEILYCGVCHSDIHTVRGEWGPIPPMSIPGHEIVGRVVAVGAQVTRFRLGDMAGVGCMVDSCGTCESCLRGEEQYCRNTATWTYGAKADVPGGVTQGGWSKGIVVTENFVIRMPQTGNLAAMAPLLCAGVTTFSPLRHWKAEKGMRVGVLGVGGLGHMAAKLAAAHGADVTLFTSTPGKLADAKRLGARDAVLTSDAKAMAAHADRYDLIISTVPESFPLAPYLPLLTLNGTLVSVGTPADLQQVSGGALWWRRRSVASSLIGSIAETQDVIDYCAARNLSADIELIRPEQINAAMDRVKGKDVRYRFVIDMTQA